MTVYSTTSPLYRSACALLAGLTVLAASSTATAQQPLPPPVVELQRFAGLYVGQATLTQAGQPTISAFGFQFCVVVARGWGVQCTARFTNSTLGLEFNEGIQGGYDAASDLINWSTFTSFGQAFTLTGNFFGDTLELSRYITLPNGSILEQSGGFTFSNNDRDLALTDTTIIDGVVAAEITFNGRRIGF